MSWEASCSWSGKRKQRYKHAMSGYVAGHGATADTARQPPPRFGSISYTCYVNAQYVQAFPLPRETT